MKRSGPCIAEKRGTFYKAAKGVAVPPQRRAGLTETKERSPKEMSVRLYIKHKRHSDIGNESDRDRSGMGLMTGYCFGPGPC